MDSVIEDALEQRSIYSRSLGRALGKIGGPHYNPIFNRVSLPKDDALGTRRYLLALHELEHAFHRNSNPTDFALLAVAYPKELFMVFRTPVSPVMRRRIEMRAVGAQWELASRIPAAVRRKLLDELKAASRVLSPELKPKQIAGIQSLFSSGLVDELRSALAQIRVDTPEDMNRLVARFLIAKDNGTQPYLLSQAKDVVSRSGLSNERMKELSEFFEAFFKRRDRILAASRARSVKPALEFRMDLNPNDFSVYDRAVERLEKIANERSNQGQLEMAFNKIFIASLENAHLSKADFIDRVAPLHGYALQNLVDSHLNLDSAWKAYLAISTAASAGIIAYKGEPLNPDKMLGANDLILLIKALTAPFESERYPLPF